MILKFQKPLASNVSNPRILVYNEDRTYVETLPTDHIIGKLPEKTIKFYADCSIVDDEPVIRKIVEDPGW